MSLVARVLDGILLWVVSGERLLGETQAPLGVSSLISPPSVAGSGRDLAVLGREPAVFWDVGHWGAPRPREHHAGIDYPACVVGKCQRDARSMEVWAKLPTWMPLCTLCRAAPQCLELPQAPFSAPPSVSLQPKGAARISL